MQYEISEEIDYEHLDDLPLFEHVEWNHLEESSLDLAPVPSEPIYYC